jgi:hypothetical protein
MDNVTTIISNIIATTIIFPMDTMRVQKQLDLPTIYNIRSLYKGYSAGVLRQIMYSSPNLIIYRSLNNMYGSTTEKESPILFKSVCGFVSGGISGVLGNSAELLFVRAVKDPHYTNIVQSASQIYNSHGLREFTKGSLPMGLRCAIFNAARLPIYSESKHILNDTYPTYNGHVYIHFVAAFTSAFMGTIASSPIDVVKSNIQQSSSKKNIGDMFRQIYALYGIAGFYKGFIPSLLRTGPHSILSFLMIDQFSLFFSGKELL